MQEALRRIVARLEIDRAVFYAICLRTWQLAAGAVSLVLVSIYFSPEVQGYHYTFVSLLAFQTFFDLGMNIAVINTSSHEWARLRIDEQGRIAGDPEALSRLASLGRFLLVWSSVTAFCFTIVVGAGGGFFLARDAQAGVAWAAPWACLTCLTGGLVWTLPFNAVLEGCGQITVVNRYRLLQAVGSNLAIWTIMVLGGGLWAPVAASAMRLLLELVLLGVRYRKFFAAFRLPPAGPRLQWRHELWPMQWRLAVTGLFGYLAAFLFTPVMFHYHGAAVAGRMGMTKSLLDMLQMGGLAWVQTRAPLFGRLVAARNFRELDRVFFRTSGISQGVVVVAGLCLWLGVVLLGQVAPQLASRLLGPTPTAVFLLSVVVGHFAQCQTFYLRAHKREFLLAMGAASNLLIGLGVWWFGKAYGPLGCAAAHLAVVSLVILPWETAIWRQCRRDHPTEEPAVPDRTSRIKDL